jgi:hypothetical protein
VGAKSLASGAGVWSRLSASQREQLASLCQARALASNRNPSSYLARQHVGAAEVGRISPTQLAASIGSGYSEAASDKAFGEPGESIGSACEGAIYRIATAAQEAGERSAERREAEIKRSVAGGSFIATDDSVRHYMAIEQIATPAEVRAVECTDQRSCSVGYNVPDPTSHPILATIFNQPDDPESQLVEPMAKVLAAVFADRRMESATVTEWTELESVGGKPYMAPVLRVSCDRAAANKIGWERVTPNGLRRLCAYKLLPK